MDKRKFIGIWKLISFEISFKEKTEKFFPYGESPHGYLLYTQDEHVSVHFMSSDRSLCKSDDYKNATPEEKMEIADNYGGYFGKYEIKEDVIIHYPDICAFPNFINVPQIRNYKLSGAHLILECAYVNKNGINGCSKIIWEKCTFNQ